MTDCQRRLIAKLSDQKIEAAFNGDFLNCKVAITSGTKIKWQKFSFLFDSADDCQGSRALPHTFKGAYSERFAREAFDIIVVYSNEVAEEEIV